MDVPSHSPFGKNLQSFVREKCVNSKNLELTEKFILFGVLQNVFTDKVFDLTSMLSMFYITKVNGRKLFPISKFFKDKYTVTVEIIFTCVYITTDRLHDFDLQWPPYKGLTI